MITNRDNFERTSKKWKAWMLGGAGAMIAGGALYFTADAGDTASSTAQAGGGLMLFMVGLATAVCAKIGAWWCHG